MRESTERIMVSGVPAYMAKAIDAAFPETKARAVKVRRIIQAWLDARKAGRK